MKFNWHELDRAGFLSWMVINLVTAKRKENEVRFNELNLITDSFKDVDMKITINGIDVPVDYFVQQVQSNMKYYARQAADEIAGDITDEIDTKVREMLEVIEEATESIKTKVDSFFDE